MKIALSNILVYEPFKVLYDPLLEIIRSVVRPDTELVTKYVDKCTLSIHHAYFEYYNTLGAMENVIQAEKEGCDAAIIVCNTDPGLYVIREAVNIPVVGLLESAALIAAMLAHKFAVVTPFDKWEGSVENSLVKYGLRDKLIAHPVRGLGFGLEWYGRMGEEPGGIVTRFKEVARACVADGAEAIVSGCVCLSFVCLTQGVSQIDGVPLIHGLVTAPKMAEILVDLRKPPFNLMTSRKGLYQLPPKEEMEEFRKTFGLPVP
jgi:allantoin racemase